MGKGEIKLEDDTQTMINAQTCVSSNLSDSNKSGSNGHNSFKSKSNKKCHFDPKETIDSNNKKDIENAISNIDVAFVERKDPFHQV